MAEPKDHTLRRLREIREQGNDVRQDLDKLGNRVDQGFSDVRGRLDNLQQAMIGESVLGRYTVAEVEQRLDAMEKRLSALEKRRS